MMKYPQNKKILDLFELPRETKLENGFCTSRGYDAKQTYYPLHCVFSCCKKEEKDALDGVFGANDFLLCCVFFSTQHAACFSKTFCCCLWPDYQIISGVFHQTVYLLESHIAGDFLWCMRQVYTVSQNSFKNSFFPESFKTFGIVFLTQSLSMMNKPFFDAIFIVNLKRRPDRWQSIVSQAQAAGLLSSQFSSSSSSSSSATMTAMKSNHNHHDSVVRRIDAYDGSLFSENSVKRCELLSPMGVERAFKLEEQHKIWGMDLNKGGIGCALSHVDIWCRVVEEKLQRALVLEDDTVFSHEENFVDVVQKDVWEFVPRDWQYVFLSGLDPEKQARLLRVAKTRSSIIITDDQEKTKTGGNNNNKTSRFICCVPRIYRTTNCYVVNAVGAASLLQKCVPFTFQLDTAMTTMLVDAETSSSVNPHYKHFEQLDDATTSSVNPHYKHFEQLDDATTSSGGGNNTKSALNNQQQQQQQQQEEMAALRKEFVSVIPGSYCVDPPVAAQATRFGSDIQWKRKNQDPTVSGVEEEEGSHDYADEERSRCAAAGIRASS